MSEKSLAGMKIIPHSIFLIIVITVIVAALLTVSTSCSDSESNQEGKIVRESWSFANVVDSLAISLEKYYVVPEIGIEMADSLRDRLNAGVFDNIKDGDSLLMTVNSLLQRISRDAHLKVSWLDPEEANAGNADSVNEQELVQWKSENYGFRHLEILDGNIGYIDIREFRDTTYASRTLAAVSDFLANSEALIIDLRHCRGGRPEMVQLLASYLFPKPTLLSSSYDRYEDASAEFWSLSEVAGTPLYEVPVVVIVGPRTASAGEGFISALMRLGRARSVGERTAGAGHLARIIDFPSIDIRLKLPTGKPANGQGFQGAGIEPDIPAEGHKALLIAHAVALKSAAETTADELKARKMLWLADGLMAQSRPINLSVETLKSYVGQYQGEQDLVSIVLDSTGLCAIENSLPAVHLLPFSEHVFTTKEYPEDRGKFVFGHDKTRAEKLIILSSDGLSLEFRRTGK